MVVIGKSSRVQVSGPMEAYVAGFEAELKRLGFTHLEHYQMLTRWSSSSHM